MEHLVAVVVGRVRVDLAGIAVFDEGSPRGVVKGGTGG
jgi:hypothetical protein